MTSWLRRTQAGIQSAPTTPATNSAPLSATYVPANYSGGKQRDANAPDARLDVEAKCIYERRLPGKAYITAHVTRLQDGFYDTPSTHGNLIDHVRFIAVSFCFHPEETINRFQAATICISLHDDTDQKFTDRSAGHKPQYSVPVHKPKFLKFAPHVLYGGVSPETLDWNFNLTGSLGVSQTPVSASLSPSGGVKSSYKIYQMMRIQGSKRTLRSGHHQDYDIEDGEVFWTLEENPLQKSGLPREFTFVMLATKGDVENVVFQIDIEPKIAAWFGHYPRWWCSTPAYLPLQKEAMDLDTDLGQRFVPEIPGKGYNFADLASTFESYVSLPGTTTSATDTTFTNQPAAATNQQGPSALNQQQQSAIPQQMQQPQSARLNTSAAAPKGQSGDVSGGKSSLPKSSQPNQSNSGGGKSIKPDSSQKPVDYDIYLDNPRSIRIHASSPAPQPEHNADQHDEQQHEQHEGQYHDQHVEGQGKSAGQQHAHHQALRPLKTDPESLSHPNQQPSQSHQHSSQNSQRLSQSQSQSNSVPSQLRTPKRPTSNTKLKRRSIDISYMSTTPSSQSSSQRQSSLRRSRSKSDLRAASSPLVEEPEDDRLYNHSQSHSGKDKNSSTRVSARSPQQSVLQADARRPLRNRDSPSPPRFRRDHPARDRHDKLQTKSKRYSMPAYMYVNDDDN